MSHDRQDEIRQRYGDIARAVGATGCCGSDCACGDPISSNLYSERERQQLPADAVAASLGRLRGAGFIDVSVEPWRTYDDTFASAFIRARKPAAACCASSCCAA